VQRPGTQDSTPEYQSTKRRAEEDGWRETNVNLFDRKLAASNLVVGVSRRLASFVVGLCALPLNLKLSTGFFDSVAVVRRVASFRVLVSSLRRVLFCCKTAFVEL
jgi:hypothetical protein